MKRSILIFATGVVFSSVSTLSLAQQTAQLAAPYTAATRYNVAGQVTGTIAPDPDGIGAGTLGHPATRNTYGTGGATIGLLEMTEVGQLSAWADDSILPSAWSGFTVFQRRTFEYDALGRKIAERVIGQDLTTVESLIQYSYDSWDRVVCKAVRMNLVARPDACEVGGEGIDGPDRITRFTYDGYDQVLTQERAVDTSIAQTYVTNVYYGRGALQSQTDANGNKTELRYDGNWRLQKRVYPSKFTPGGLNESDFNEYSYDKNGNVVLERKRNGATVASTYDANNRLIFKDLSDNTYSGDISYDYDLRGLTLSSCFGSTDSCATSGEGETNEFDGLGNLTSRTSRMAGTFRTLGYQYDLEGNRKRVTHPDSWFFEYGFDGLNRMNSLAESASASPSAVTSNLLTISYRASGGRESIVRTGGATTSIEPNNALRLKKFTQDFALTTNDLANEFGYNHASQVISLSQSNTQYNYTEADNRTGGYGVNGLNQYTSIDGGPTIAYDGNGNLTSDGEGRSYTYDMENHLIATGGSASSTLVYDVLGRLAQISVNGTTTQFHYDGDALVGEYVSGALTRRYVHGDQVDEPLVLYTNGVVSPATRRYLHADHQGSVIAQSDNAGAVIQKNAYDPYGIPATTNDGRFGYTGQTWLKELGLNYYKARIYSPKLGRFLQTDSIFYADDMNMYAYVGNDPINKTDPTGAYSCGDSLSKSQCESFNKAQDQAKAQISGTLKTVGSIQGKLSSGEKLTKAEQAVASRIDKTLGAGASSNAKTLGALSAAGNKMLGQLNSSMPANIGNVGAAYARADGNQLTLNQSKFFGASTGMASQIVAHESHHHALYSVDTTLRYVTPKGIEMISPYGLPDAMRRAEILNDPTRMLSLPDPTTFALGFDRDDD